MTQIIPRLQDRDFRRVDNGNLKRLPGNQIAKFWIVFLPPPKLLIFAKKKNTEILNPVFNKY